jgi:hypothetical protein
MVLFTKKDKTIKGKKNLKTKIPTIKPKTVKS